MIKTETKSIGACPGADLMFTEVEPSDIRQGSIIKLQSLLAACKETRTLQRAEPIGGLSLARVFQADPRDLLESQIRECYGRCAYAHKTHERMAERFDRFQSRLKWANILLSALITGGAVGALLDSSAPLAEYSALAGYATAALAILSLIFNSCMKEFDPGSLTQKHRETAASIWNVRESYLSLLSDLLDEGLSLNIVRERRDILQERLYEIYSTAPPTDGIAYGEAQDRLKNKEDLTFSEGEIDQLLPSALRRRSRVQSEGAHVNSPPP
jgi:hypothetical protein